MSDNELVDVVLPVFNGQDTIHLALQSVFKQDQALLGSIIVVNDGSTDNTLNVLAKFQHPKLIIFSTKNQGVALARNYGIQKSNSKWVAFLDADDIWRCDKLQVQLHAAKKNQASFICCRVGKSIFINSRSITQHSLFRGNFIATSSVLVSRELAFNEHPLFNAKMKFAEDYLAWFKLLCNTKGFYLSEPLVEYYVSPYPHYQPVEIIFNLLNLEKFATQYLFSCSLSPFQKIASWISLSFGIMLSGTSIFKRFLKAL